MERAVTDIADIPHILVVDDDTRLRKLLSRYLGENGFRVTTAESAEQARRKFEGLSFDLAVLDVMMPGEDGTELTRSIRQAKDLSPAHQDLPILLLTARAEPEDRIDGLEAGADDYLPKPFEPKELLLRIHSILRRAAPVIEVKQAVEGPLKIGPWVFNPEREELIGDTETVRLTQAETRLLKALARTPGEIVTRDDLTDGSDLAGNTRTIDVQMNRLRRKVEIDPRNPRHLMTVRGEGYVLRPGD
ncbi:MAG: DNA-binding response regulator [Alphaproteobacteria bacterium]|nr:DNA-binding response regulator [Alphaproteobacteria bacterium]MAS48940.1 DNA-binding response regulator [Alphaproteobacteria bacterium]MAX97458.1 DNA-binding response regulator [Alphaproteobacteria bacterium]MBN52672.1 DNA-binding response regulator [Alphaproteobacteria bacterium]OUT39550.1 MAG: DNA-binding response regulator [Micavibrio sp. TMED2]|tara:strand:+ start:3798 stop:4535 length:738 start_codon:yes stop_codon:yes gene_type:complete